jgi:hypothetical protein
MQYQADSEQLLPFLERIQQELPGLYFKPSTSFAVEPGNATCNSWAAVSSDGPQAEFSYTLEPAVRPGIKSRSPETTAVPWGGGLRPMLPHTGAPDSGEKRCATMAFV